MSAPEVLDLERVICRLSDLEAAGARAFTIGAGEWPLKGFVVATDAGVRGYVNRCPHAGHPLDLLPGHFLTADGALIVCASHGALFDRESGFCLAGPCAGRSLTPIAVQVIDGLVLIGTYSNRSMPS